MMKLIKEIKNWIESNFKRNDNILFGIGDISDKDKIYEYQVVSENLFSTNKKEFINFYSKTNYLINLKDFKCTSNYFELIYA